jgi:hypothetical protein
MYLRDKFHMPSANGWSVAALRLRANQIFRTATTLLYTLQKYCLNKVAYFARSITICNLKTVK